jgi:PAS domain S-box-containing protein
LRPRDLGIGHLFERVRDAIIVADAHTGRIVLWNPAATEIFGYSVSEALEMNVEELVPERFRERHRAGLARYRGTGHGPFVDSRELLDLPALRKSGGEVRIEMSLSTIEPVRDVGHEERRYALAVVRDITERTTTEGALRESEERFHALVQNSLDIVMVTDAQGAIRYVSPSVERVLGYRSEEMVGTSTAEYVHPEDLERALGELAEAASKTGVHPVAVETRVRHKDGSWRHLEGIANNLLDDPFVGGMVFNHRDVTERKRGEEEIRRLNEELENRVKERTARLETALAELGSSEERYRLLVESAKDYAIFMVDPSGRVLDWNAGAERIFGYKEEDIVGEQGSILFTPEDIRGGAPERELEKAREEGRAADERWHMRKDGSRFWASGFVRPVRDGAGNLRGFAKVARDITERRRTEDELRASEERFRATFEQAAVGVAHLGSDGRWLRVNNKLFEITGYPREELLQKNFQDITHPDDLGADLEKARQLLAGEIETYSMEKRYIKKDGSTVWINLTGSLVRESSGEPDYFIAVIEDITERKKAEEALSQSESRYRAVVEQSADGIYLVDAGAGRILETNPALRGMLGYGAEELRGMELHEIVAHDPEDVYANVERTLREGWRFIRERRYRRKDGSVVEVEVAASAIDYGDKQVICAAIRDITERKRAEEARREIRDAERRRIARDLHDGVLQDLSYTSAAIGMIMLQAEEAGLQEQLQAAVDAVRRGAEGLREVVNDLRIEDEDGRPFTEMVESLVRRNQTMAKHVEISLDVGERVTAKPLGVTGTQASRLMQEALTNARRHAGAKRITVGLRMDGPDLIAEVADDGVGFGPETLPGVGLSSMRERAAVIGGDLKIESGKEWGTRVRLQIPLSEDLQE